MRVSTYFGEKDFWVSVRFSIKNLQDSVKQKAVLSKFAGQHDSLYIKKAGQHDFLLEKFAG